MASAQNSEPIVTFLQNPKSYDFETENIKIVHTHASILALAPPFVLKVKKQIDLGFMDFRKLEDRKANCERELQLNRRLCDDIYLAVVQIYKVGSTLSFQKSQGATIVDYALQMKLLENGYFLPQLLEKNKVTEATILMIIEKLQRFYEQQGHNPAIDEFAKPDSLRKNADDNFKSLRENLHDAPELEDFCSQNLDLIADFSYRIYLNHAALFEDRVAEKKIKDCHGDLHLDHIHIQNDKICIFDCLEFSDRYRYSDVAADLAFLAMDLDFHGHPQFARFVVEKMAMRMGDDGLLQVADYYKSYRAMVRAKVDLLQLKQTTASKERQQLAEAVSRYLQLALRYLVLISKPSAFIICGRIGTGKTTLSNALAKSMALPHINSDVVRKQNAGKPIYERSHDEDKRQLYSAENTHTTYDQMLQECITLLKSGQSVVLDATFGDRAQRDKFTTSLKDYHFHFIETCATDDIVKTRLAVRDGKKEASDARLEDFDKLSSAYQSPGEIKELIKVDTGKPLEENVKYLLKRVI